MTVYFEEENVSPCKLMLERDEFSINDVLYPSDMEEESQLVDYYLPPIFDDYGESSFMIKVFRTTILT